MNIQNRIENLYYDEWVPDSDYGIKVTIEDTKTRKKTVFITEKNTLKMINDPQKWLAETFKHYISDFLKASDLEGEAL